MEKLQITLVPDLNEITASSVTAYLSTLWWS